MTIIKAKVSGNPNVSTLDVTTIGEAKDALGLEANYKGAIRGVAKDDNFEVSTDDVLIFAANVKGGQ